MFFYGFMITLVRKYKETENLKELNCKSLPNICVLL
jgi:hypothetical protein